MNYNALADTSPEKHSEFVAWLSEQTVTALINAQGDSLALQNAIKQFLLTAMTANLKQEEIENILGVNEPCILDLAGLSEEDEEVVVATFEHITEQ